MRMDSPLLSGELKGPTGFITAAFRSQQAHSEARRQWALSFSRKEFSSILTFSIVLKQKEFSGV